MLLFKVKVLVAQSCLTHCEPINCSPPCSSVHRIFQTRILEWVAISFSSGSSRPRDGTRVYYWFPLNLSILLSLTLVSECLFTFPSITNCFTYFFSSHLFSLPHGLRQYFSSFTAHHCPSVFFLPCHLSYFAPGAKLSNMNLKSTKTDITKIVVLGIMLEGEMSTGHH